MSVLLWLAPSGVVLLVMMAWAAWAGRAKPEQAVRSEAAYERFAAAIGRAHPGASKARPATVRDRSTGIAVRPSRREATQPTRRSA